MSYEDQELLRRATEFRAQKFKASFMGQRHDAKPATMTRVHQNELPALMKNISRITEEHKDRLFKSRRDACGTGGCNFKRESRDVVIREVFYEDNKHVDEYVVHNPISNITYKRYDIMLAPRVNNFGSPDPCPAQIGEFKRTQCLPSIDTMDLNKLISDPFVDYLTHPSTWSIEKRREYLQLLDTFPADLRSLAPHAAYFSGNMVEAQPMLLEPAPVAPVAPVVVAQPAPASEVVRAQPEPTLWDRLKYNFTVRAPEKAGETPVYHYTVDRADDEAHHHHDFDHHARMDDLNALIREDQLAAERAHREHQALVDREYALRNAEQRAHADHKVYMSELERRLAESEAELARLKLGTVPAQPVVVESPVAPPSVAPVIIPPSVPASPVMVAK